MRPFRAATLPAYPWANGGGTSRQVAACPPGAALGSPELVWQVSLAAIERSGPFSALPGVDRQFVLLTGRVTLAFTEPAFERSLGALEPFAFRGDPPPACRLVGAAALALNVMTRQRPAGPASAGAAGAASVEVLHPTGTTVVEKPPGIVLIVIVAVGRLRVLADGAAAHLDEPGDGIALDDARYGQASLTPVGPAPACVVVRLTSDGGAGA